MPFLNGESDVPLPACSNAQVSSMPSLAGLCEQQRERLRERDAVSETTLGEDVNVAASTPAATGTERAFRARGGLSLCFWHFSASNFSVCNAVSASRFLGNNFSSFGNSSTFVSLRKGFSSISNSLCTSGSGGGGGKGGASLGGGGNGNHWSLGGGGNGATAEGW